MSYACAFEISVLTVGLIFTFKVYFGLVDLVLTDLCDKLRNSNAVEVI